MEATAGLRGFLPSTPSGGSFAERLQAGNLVETAQGAVGLSQSSSIPKHKSRPCPPEASHPTPTPSPLAPSTGTPNEKERGQAVTQGGPKSVPLSPTSQRPGHASHQLPKVETENQGARPPPRPLAAQDGTAWPGPGVRPAWHPGWGRRLGERGGGGEEVGAGQRVCRRSNELLQPPVSGRGPGERVETGGATPPKPWLQPEAWAPTGSSIPPFSEAAGGAVGSGPPGARRGPWGPFLRGKGLARPRRRGSFRED